MTKIFMPFIDRVLHYTASKKLTVFIFATVFLHFDRITSEQWIKVALIYIGFQTAIDVAKEIKK